PTVMDSRVEAALGPLSSRQVLEAQREEGLAALLEIAEDLGRHLEVSELLPRVAERLLALFRRADRCLVLRWVPADEQFRAEQVRGRGAQPPRECFSQTIARRCLETGQAFLCRDTYADASLNRLGSVAEGEIRSVMTVPLVLPRGE